MDFINDNVIKCLKLEIDAYRDKYAIALQEIKELNYFSKEDNDKLKADNRKLIDMIKELKRANKTMDGILLEREAEIKSLNADNKRLYQEHKECRNNG